MLKKRFIFFIIILVFSGILFSLVGASNQQKYTGFWKVTKTAADLKKLDINFQKLILRDNGDFEIHILFQNEPGSLPVIQKGNYKITGNKIDYNLLKTYMFEKEMPAKPIIVKGTIYLKKNKLYFTYIDFTEKNVDNRLRRDALNKKYQNIAELVEK